LKPVRLDVLVPADFGLVGPGEPSPPEYGLFGPGSITWRVDREIAVLLGSGSRALLLQVAHPKVAAAVADHSRYRSDPLGRLRDTLDAIYGFAFEDTRRVQRILEHIHALHTRVHGRTPENEPYSALDPHLLLWVYSTLIDSSLLAYETFVAPLEQQKRERYYAEFCQAGPLWGIPAEHFPESLASLRRWMAQLIDSGEVRVTPQGRHVGRYILEPGAWWMPPPVALLMRLVTVWLLPTPLRAGFGYTWGPRRERLAENFAAFSRAVVPRLPRLMRDLPLARAADRRARGVALQSHAAGAGRRPGPPDGARRASSARAGDLW
jgi:uncharacterized protein (DUF2236 family)